MLSYFSVRITETTDNTIEFEVEESGDYILKWQVAKASSGMNEALVGNILLIRHDATGIIGIYDSENTDDYFFDLNGRRIAEPAKSGIYLYKGKKYFVK